MIQYTDDELELAVLRYVGRLDLEDLQQRVAEDLYYGLKKSSDAEIAEFVEMVG